MTETHSKFDLRGALRWLLLALGAGAILLFSSNTGFSDFKQKPVSIPLDANDVEPAPLVFRPDIAPQDAEAINAARPDYDGPIVAAKPFIAPRTADRAIDLQRAAECLTQAVYYEAASETAAGQRAVAQVVLNRARDPRYPPSVCGVIFQGSERTTGCQFTFTCDGALARKPDPFLLARARLVAIAALNGAVEPLVGLATHYHTKQVVPVWRTELVKLRTVGAHIFYGWQGRERSRRGLRTGYAGIEPVIGPTPPSADLLTQIAPSLDPLAEPANPFAAPAPDAPLSGPTLPAQDFGTMRADNRAGELAVREGGGLAADDRAGTLDRP